VMKLGDPRYADWRVWLDSVYWDVGAKE